MVHVDYEWDPKKAALNLKKHEVSFADAVTVFADDRALTFDDSQPDEERHITLGMDALLKFLLWSTPGVETGFGLFRHVEQPLMREGNTRGDL